MESAQDKTILLVVNNAFLTRSFLRSDLLHYLKKGFKKVVVLAPPTKVEQYKARYQRDNAIIESIPESNLSIAGKILCKFLKFSIPSRTTKIFLMMGLFRVKGGPEISTHWLFFPFLFISWHLARYRFWRQILRKIFQSFKVDPNCLAVLQEHQPDVVFARYSLTALDNFNLKLFKAAQKLNITTVGMIFSWDNLYTKVSAAVQADFSIAGNELSKREAVRLVGIREDSIEVTGLPQFDFYFKKELLMARAAFFETTGLDPKKKLIIFGMGADHIDPEHFLDYFSRLAKKQLRDVQFYIRPHPKAKLSQEIIDRFKHDQNIIIEPREDCVEGRDFEFKENDEQFLFNLLHHAQVLITYYTTLMIEGCVCDTPVINLNYSGGLKVNYWHSIEKAGEHEHIKQIEKNNCGRWVNNDEELLKEIKIYLAHPERDCEGRQKTVKEQVYFADGFSSQRISRFLIKIANNKGRI